MTCVNNLKQLGLALHNHHDAKNTFPIAGSLDPSGTPGALTIVGPDEFQLPGADHALHRVRQLV